MLQTPTKPSGTRKLSEVARHLVLPTGIVSTGFGEVKQRANDIGIEFDEWQAGLGKALLAKRADGQYACGIGGAILSIPRQTGKTFTIGVIIVILCTLLPGLKVLWTAHRARTSDETFATMLAIVSRRRLANFVLDPRRANGQQEIRFRNGSRIMFGARERGFGRGFDDVDIEVFDEAQILTQKALDDMVPATNVAENPLLIFIGTPPKPTDPGEAFKSFRREALAHKELLESGIGEEHDGLFVEISADEHADLDDVEQWAKGNPSYPHRTKINAIKRLRKILDDESFKREALGIWDSDAPGSRAITPDDWALLGIPEAPETGTKCFAIAFSLDGARVALAGSRRNDDWVHVELLDAASGDVASGLEDLADWLASRWRDVAEIVIAGQAGAPVLAQLLKERRVPVPVVRIATTPEYFKACSMFLDTVRTSVTAISRGAETLPLTHLLHEGQEQLDNSIAVCDKKARGLSGAWGWYATTPDGDETPTEAASLALWIARTTRRKPRGDRERKAVVFS